MLMTMLAAGYITAGSSRPVYNVAHILAMWQAQDSINSGNSKLLMIFIGIAAFALLAQAVVLVAVGLGALKAVKEIKVHVEELRGKAEPLIDKAHALVVDLTPEVKQIASKVNGLVTDLTPEIKLITTKVHEITVKVEEISGHFEEIAGVAKDKVHEFAPTISAANDTMKDANRKTQEQIDRVNGLVSGALDATVQMGAAIKHGITAPGREIAGMVNGVKETMSTLVTGTKASVNSIVHGTQGSVESLVHGTKGTVESFLHGIRGLSDSLSAANRKERAYSPGSYRTNPAPLNPPTRTGFAGEPRQGFPGGPKAPPEF